MKENRFSAQIACLEIMTGDNGLTAAIDGVSNAIMDCYRRGAKTLWIGNGGSATQAEHLAGELSGRFLLDRKPLPALTPYGTASLTAIANDYGYDKVFSRFVESCAKKGDVVIGLSTSGNSKNVINAFKSANELGAVTVAFTGKTGGEMKSIAEHTITVPSLHTPVIQEIHLMIGHMICGIVEESLHREGLI
jgi:D-sedoheptulose 7-phosphate isomerase